MLGKLACLVPAAIGNISPTAKSQTHPPLANCVKTPPRTQNCYRFFPPVRYLGENQHVVTSFSTAVVRSQASSALITSCYGGYRRQYVGGSWFLCIIGEGI